MGSRQAPDAMRAERDAWRCRASSCEPDLDRGENIRASLPEVGGDCDEFYHESFLDVEDRLLGH